MSKTVKITSQENESFTITTKAAERSSLLTNAMKDYPEDSMIPLPDVKTKSLAMIVKFLEHYENEDPKPIPKPLEPYNPKFPNKYNDYITEWDIAYLESITGNMDFFIELLNAAFYMEIIPLQDLLGTKLLWMMISKDNPEEIRALLGIGEEDDKLGPEELKELEELGL